MRRSHKLMAALAVAPVALVACNVLTGLDADYSASGHDGAVAPVGEGGGGDGPGSDGQGGDGGTTDGMVNMDGGDGAVLTAFCQNAKDGSADVDFFCTDFEDNDAIVPAKGPRGFAALVDNVDGGFAILAGEGKDGSHVLDVVSDTTSTSIYRQVRVSKQFDYVRPPDQYAGFEMDFDFRVLSSVVNYDAYALLLFGAKENGIAGYGPLIPHQISREGPKGAFLDNSMGWNTAHISLEHPDAGTAFVRSISVNTAGVLTTIETNDTQNHVFDTSAAPVLMIGTFNTSMSAGLSHVQFDNIIVRRRQFP